MALEHFILPSNVVKVAGFLLNLDASAIEERYAQDVHGLIQSLQQHLDACQHPLPAFSSGEDRLAFLGQELDALLTAVKALLLYLTPEAQQAVRAFVGTTLVPIVTGTPA